MTGRYDSILWKGLKHLWILTSESPRVNLLFLKGHSPCIHLGYHVCSLSSFTAVTVRPIFSCDSQVHEIKAFLGRALC